MSRRRSPLARLGHSFVGAVKVAGAIALMVAIVTGGIAAPFAILWLIVRVVRLAWSGE